MIDPTERILDHIDRLITLVKVLSIKVDMLEEEITKNKNRDCTGPK